mmetsp:Transcript_69856/g.186029  ORF Transcript_69856/g.186029 Transcript_69856/m.186029 type:complete len:421 (+) Transcript_69856:761-2023(+)
MENNPIPVAPQQGEAVPAAPGEQAAHHHSVGDRVLAQSSKDLHRPDGSKQPVRHHAPLPVLQGQVPLQAGDGNPGLRINKRVGGGDLAKGADDGQAVDAKCNSSHPQARVQQGLQQEGGHLEQCCARLFNTGTCNLDRPVRHNHKAREQQEEHQEPPRRPDPGLLLVLRTHQHPVPGVLQVFLSGGDEDEVDGGGQQSQPHGQADGVDQGLDHHPEEEEEGVPGDDGEDHHAHEELLARSHPVQPHHQLLRGPIQPGLLQNLPHNGLVLRREAVHAQDLHGRDVRLILQVPGHRDYHIGGPVGLGHHLGLMLRGARALVHGVGAGGTLGDTDAVRDLGPPLHTPIQQRQLLHPVVHPADPALPVVPVGQDIQVPVSQGESHDVGHSQHVREQDDEAAQISASSGLHLNPRILGLILLLER